MCAQNDGLDGAVVTAARDALESGNVNRVLIRARGEEEAASCQEGYGGRGG